MLHTFHKAFVRNVFTPENKPPIELKDLEIYLQILYPVYQFSLIMQKDKSSIADVLPTLIITKSKLNRMAVDGDFKLLCSYIIAALNYKFNYELNTNYYCVATLLNISKLHNWASRADCSFIRETALEKISKTAEIFIFNKQKSGLIQNTLECQSSQSNQSQASVDSVGGFFEEDNFESQPELIGSIQSLQLEREGIEYLKILDSKKWNFENKSTGNFWLAHQKQFPLLSKLAAILLNIPSSSACIERYYSICGNVVKQRCGNMSAETIIARSMLKSNIKLLDELSQ